MKNIQLLLTLFLLSVMTACQPVLKEFQPENDSLFRIAFSYPANWVWEEQIPFDDFVGEPPPSELIVAKNGAIEVQVFKPSDPQTEMQAFIGMYVKAVGNMLRADTTIQIDGYDARWLTVVYPPQNTSEADVQESIYLLTEDRYYVIGFSYTESETNGRFHKECKELIKTIEILR